MIRILLLSFAFLFSAEKEMTTNLNGTWKLVKIEITGKTLLPEHDEDFKLRIIDSTMQYNRGPNRCSCKIQIDKNTINSKGGCGCTKIAEHDPICAYLDYTGTYILKDSLLTVINSKGKFYLKRISSK